VYCPATRISSILSFEDIQESFEHFPQGFPLPQMVLVPVRENEGFGEQKSQVLDIFRQERSPPVSYLLLAPSK
jgi:hypothetical protein